MERYMEGLMIRRVQRYTWWVLNICLLLAAASASAQVDQGAITGTVRDNSGAAVPGADIKIVASGTGLTLHQKSNGSGNYTFAPIKIGDYIVSASDPGFQT